MKTAIRLLSLMTLSTLFLSASARAGPTEQMTRITGEWRSDDEVLRIEKHNDRVIRVKFCDLETFLQSGECKGGLVLSYSYNDFRDAFDFQGGRYCSERLQVSTSEPRVLLRTIDPDRTNHGCWPSGTSEEYVPAAPRAP